MAISKPNLLYVTPLVPAITGDGSTMRSGMVLQALSCFFNIHMLVYPLRPERLLMTVDLEFVTRLCARVVIVPRSLVSQAIAPTVLSTFDDLSFEAVWAFRLALAPLLSRYLACDRSARPVCALDLDDFESKARLRISQLMTANGDQEHGVRVAQLAAESAALEARYLPAFDITYVCSDEDRNEVDANYDSGLISVLPNAVAIPKCSREKRERERNSSLRLLFVGSMNYFPNVDGVTFFLQEILPLIRMKSGMDVSLTVAGRDPVDHLRALCNGISGVTLTGQVPDVSEMFLSADIVVVPLRAGGGTRIKILEAWSYSRAVVSTHLGAEGLGATDGENLLLADSPQDFADACLRLLGDHTLRERIAAAGFDRVSQRFTIDNVISGLETTLIAAVRERPHSLAYVSQLDGGPMVSRSLA